MKNTFFNKKTKSMNEGVESTCLSINVNEKSHSSYDVARSKPTHKKILV